MISLHKCADLSAIRDLKRDYLQSLIAPLDGMWEVAFIDPSPHWEMRWDGGRAGYCAANDEGTLLQFYVCPEFAEHESALFEHVVGQKGLRKATVGTNDPPYLALCLDRQTKVEVHTLLYEARREAGPDSPNSKGLGFRRVEASELDRTIAFQKACLDGGEELDEWLRGYSANLIAREGIFVLSRGDDWLGLGELRRSETQEGIADVGMMVSQGHRRQGLAGYILGLLRQECEARNLRAICSTTVANVGAQKAISRAGFVSRHRILDVSF